MDILRQVRDRGNAELRGVVLPHRECVCVVEAKWLQPVEVVLLGKRGPHPVVGLVGVRDHFLLEDVDEARARVLGVEVEIAGLERIEADHGAAKVELADHGRIGVALDQEVVRQIIRSLDISILRETKDKLFLAVATYRVDVRREADVIEEILRIYGYNNIGIHNEVHSTLSFGPIPDPDRLENLIAEQLVGQGMMEIMTNSLTKGSYYTELNSHPAGHTVELLNPLSTDLNAMRQTLLFGGLEVISLNIKHKNPDLRLFEFGNVYRKNPEGNPLLADGYLEHRQLALFLSGKQSKEHWHFKPREFNFFDLKSFCSLIINRLGLDSNDERFISLTDDRFELSASFNWKDETIGLAGLIKPEIAEGFDISEEIWFAELHWSRLLELSNSTVKFNDIPKYPVVRRDLALVLDQEVTFQQIRELAFLVERKILREINLFDLFESEKLGSNKKSLGVSFFLQDYSKTLTDKEIDQTMENLVSAFEKKLGASLRE